MKKTLRSSILLILTLMFGLGMAAADWFAPAPEPAAICPLIGCANDEYCRRDRDCATAPGGVCNLFCPTRGCCSYPGQ